MATEPGQRAPARRAPRTPPPPRDLGGGLRCVAVPIPANPLGYTLVYALDTDRGPVLVDAGWDHEDGWNALRDGLAALGLDVTEVYGVVITHHHPDHAGLAGRLREVSGAWIAMHGADAAIVREWAKFGKQGRQDSRISALRRAGAGEDEMAAFAAWEGMPAPPAAPDRELEDGQLADLPGRRLRVIWTPGHTPGHICLHLDEPATGGSGPAGRLFTGDHVLPRITPHIGLYPYDLPDIDPLGDFLGSLDLLTGLPVAEALPAHEQGFDDLDARVTEIGRHHDERLAEVAGLLSATPATLWDLASRMSWRRSWEELHPTMRRMATGEAAAHLRLLETRGQAVRADDDGTIRFVATGRGHSRLDGDAAGE